uniref:hypothetical protein n=1 Tax=Corynebacterium sp. 12B TaxID=2080509 RepID=UPI00178C6A54
KVVYGERREILEGMDVEPFVKNMIDETLSAYVAAATEVVSVGSAGDGSGCGQLPEEPHRSADDDALDWLVLGSGCSLVVEDVALLVVVVVVSSAAAVGASGMTHAAVKAAADNPAASRRRVRCRRTRGRSESDIYSPLLYMFAQRLNQERRKV